MIAFALVSAMLAAAPADEPVTFSRQVMPILQKHCQTCHRPGDIAPMSFLSYREVRPWAKSIREKVLSRKMPPWHADAAHGVFSNDRRLSQDEIDTLVRWVDGGAREGDKSDLPAPLAFQEGWSIGKPDVVLSMTEEYTVEPKGQDQYIYFAIPTNQTEERFIQAVEFRPGNRKVVHHGLVFLKPKGMPLPSRGNVETFNKMAGFPLFKGQGDALRVDPATPVHDDACELPNGGSALSGSITSGRRPLIHSFAPGTRGDVWPEGMGMRMPADYELMLQLHYVRTEETEKDRSSVGIVFAKERPKQIVEQQWVQNYYFKIPAQADNHEARACHTLKKDVEVRGVGPHMHLRGKDMEVKAVLPGGDPLTLVKVPAYDFNWQTTYLLKEPKLLPAGTRLEVTAHYDNSAKNPSNPDPKAEVRWGDPTDDEMLIGIVFYTERPAPVTAEQRKPQ
jgi:hypothetical protein